MKKCPTCNDEEGILDPTFGITAGKNCRGKRLGVKLTEFVPDRIKEDRKKHKDQTVQPFRKGKVSKEYLDLYGTKNIQVTKEEVKHAKKVWDADYYNG